MNYNLNLPEQSIQIIGKALSQLPAGESLETINEINRQIHEQNIAREATAKKAEEKRVQERVSSAVKKLETKLKETKDALKKAKSKDEKPDN